MDRASHPRVLHRIVSELVAAAAVLTAACDATCTNDGPTTRDSGRPSQATDASQWETGGAIRPGTGHAIKAHMEQRVPHAHGASVVPLADAEPTVVLSAIGSERGKVDLFEGLPAYSRLLRQVAYNPSSGNEGVPADWYSICFVEVRSSKPTCTQVYEERERTMPLLGRLRRANAILIAGRFRRMLPDPMSTPNEPRNGLFTLRDRRTERVLWRGRAPMSPRWGTEAWAQHERNLDFEPGSFWMSRDGSVGFVSWVATFEGCGSTEQYRAIQLHTNRQR